MNDQHGAVDRIADERLQRAVQIMTTEHFTLQSGRGGTIAETNGRLSVFLVSTSSTLIAIAFIGQVSQLGQAFRVFSLLLLPVLLFLGLATFARVVQSSGEDALYVAGINRIRHFYVEVVPELSEYFVLSSHDDLEGVMASSGIVWSPMQPFLTASAMVAVINGIIGGVLVTLLAAWPSTLPLALSVALGLAVGVLIVVMEVAYGLRVDRRERWHTARFPVPSTSSITSET